MLLAEPVEIPTGALTVRGALNVPPAPAGLVICAELHVCGGVGSGNVGLSDVLHRDGFATLAVDLFADTAGTATADPHRLDVVGVAHRLTATVDWSAARSPVGVLPIGLFATATAAAAALVTAADRPASVAAVVSRGGRPDLAGVALSRVLAPTLLIVGAEDDDVLEVNEAATAEIGGLAELAVVPGATHLFEEPEARARADAIAADWFRRHLASPGSAIAIVPRREWADFLAGFSRRHRGRLVTVTAGMPAAPGQEIATGRPIDAALVATVDAGRVAAVEIRFADARSPECLAALGPKVLRVYESARGRETSIEIEDRYGLRTRIVLGPDRVLRPRDTASQRAGIPRAHAAVPAPSGRGIRCRTFRR